MITNGYYDLYKINIKMSDSGNNADEIDRVLKSVGFHYYSGGEYSIDRYEFSKNAYDMFLSNKQEATVSGIKILQTKK